MTTQELTLNLIRPQGSQPPGESPGFGRGGLRRRMNQLVEVAREEHSRLANLDAERELRARENYGGQ